MKTLKICLSLFLLILTVVSLRSRPATAAQEIRFNRDIRPLLSDRCFFCHGPDEKNRKAGLRLDTFEGATKDRGGYRAISPGKPDESELLRRVTSHESFEVMPPASAKKSPITKEEAALLRRWIEQGARYEGHWAFQPLAVSAPPEVRRRARNGIDRFILARLESAGIEPSPEADPRTLIRRLSLDLTGLLPQPEEVEKFASDYGNQSRREEVYDALVERLLASPHYGERWGRHWLDQARYADTNGYTIDGERAMWPYRDWVIRALNDDMPFDRFTIEQLAGDLLPEPAKSQLVATGFHRNTVINEEGGVDPEQARVEQVMDRVNTTGAVWLGLTVGCAQCHSHKFDPISHREYYRLYAFFNSTMDYNNQGPVVPVRQGEIFGRHEAAGSVSRPLSRDQWEKIETARLDKNPAVRGPDAAVEWLPVETVRMETEAHGRIERLDDGSYFAASNASRNDAYRILTRITVPQVAAVRLTALPDESLPGRGAGLGRDGSFTLSEFYIESEGGSHRFSEAFADDETSDWPARTATDNDRRTGWSVGAAKGPVAASFVFGQPKTFDSRQLLFILRHDAVEESGIGRFRIEVSSKIPHDRRGARLLAALKTPHGSRSPEQKRLIDSAYDSSLAVREKQKNLGVSAMVMRDTTVPRASWILTRGDFTRPDTEAGRLEPGVPEAIAPKLEGPARNRLDLASWLVSSENPLTPRVTVNRIWMRYFGRGIVETEEDFGTQGAPPTHPDLLDWLAGEFIRRGWSMKALHRLIVTSSTYRQSSHSRPDLSEIDPRNLLLARQERFRVESEIVRDAALSASGLLDRRIGGPSVRPPQPDGVYAFTQVRKKWDAAEGPDRFRRAIYTFFVRSAPYPLFTTFDAPDFQTVCTRRVRSNTPLQSLTLANDPAFIEIAEGLAVRLVREIPGAFDATLDARLRRAFELCFSRPPESDELTVLRGYVRRQIEGFTAKPETAVSLVADGLKAVGLTAPQAAALTAAARALFNTDNFITRE